MLIIIQTSPYANENVLGALFLALSSSEANEPTEIFFVGEGMYCLFKNQNQKNDVRMPVISDLIIEQSRLIKIYYINDSLNPDISLNSQFLDYAIESSFRDLATEIIQNGKNLLIL